MIISSFVWRLIAEYLERLKRAFLLVDARHGLKSSDEVLLAELRRNAVSHQIILSKVDRILMPGPKTPSKRRLQDYILKLNDQYKNIRAKIQSGNFDGPEALGEIISCSAEKSLGRGRRPGINQIRWAILAATGLDKEKRLLQAIRTMGDGTMPADVDIPSHVSSVRYVPLGDPAKPLVAWTNFDLLVLCYQWRASIRFSIDHHKSVQKTKNTDDDFWRSLNLITSESPFKQSEWKLLRWKISGRFPSNSETIEIFPVSDRPAPDIMSVYS